MKEENIVKYSAEELKNCVSQTDWQRLTNMKDEEIDVSDIPEITPELWKDAKVVIPEGKKAVSIRLDEDVLRWFKKNGRGYQTHINAVLRSYMDSNHRD